MATERDRTLEALQTAIQMEIDGKECYAQASRKSGNDLGRELLKSLAEEEDLHRKKFKEVFDAISGRKNWPVTDFRPDRGKRLRTVFARTCAAVGTGVKALDSDFDTLSVAIDKENQSYNFYNQRSNEATFGAEKEFYETLAAEEREHSLILRDYEEYLKDPASWFTEKEHHSLDGG